MSVAVAQAMRYAGCPNRRSLGVSDVFPPVSKITVGGGRDQGGVFRYFGRQIGCLVVRGCVSDGLPVSAGQNEAATPGQLFSLQR